MVVQEEGRGAIGRDGSDGRRCLSMRVEGRERAVDPEERKEVDPCGDEEAEREKRFVVVER